MFEIVSVLGWWLVLSLLGLLAFPLAWVLFPRLPDRGYGFSRALGLLIVSYLVWLGASVQALRNEPAVIWGLLLVLGIAAVLLARRAAGEFWEWAATHRTYLVSVEVITLGILILWAYVRAHSPDIVGTEKPMELAFLNGILRSETFPPIDPWLSGYAISYYYFGFVMMALLTQMTGVASGIAFNLTNAAWFALTVVGAYALLYNLISAHRGRPSPWAAGLGPLFVAVSGNLEGFLEVLHARGVGAWQQLSDGSWHSPFWSWLDIKDLVNPPSDPGAWISSRHWWWWRASRVVRDTNLAGVDVEVIDEFPFFSFLLADNHPHVLALPFVLLAIGFMLQVFLDGPRRPFHHEPKLSERSLLWIAGGSAAAVVTLIVVGSLSSGDLPESAVRSGLRTALPLLLVAVIVNAAALVLSGRLPLLMPLPQLLIAGWMFGALAFLNAWDFPIYLAVFAGVLYSITVTTTLRARLSAVAATAGLTLLVGLTAFSPWYPTFASQAGGLLPNLAFPTKIQHTIVMWGVALVPIAVWLIIRLRDGWQPREWRILLGAGLGLPLGLFLVSWLMSGVVGAVLRGSGSLDQVLGSIGASTAQQAFDAALSRRLAHSWTALVLGLLISGAVVLGLRQTPTPDDRPHTAADRERGARAPASGPPVWPFLLPLVLVGGLLILGPEFFFLRDFFGSRMNTVFKFYYGAWILWGVAAAFAMAELWPRTANFPQVLTPLAGLPLLMGLVYPVLGTLTRAQGFQPASPITLDGTAYMERIMPADAVAIDWLNAVAEQGPLAEAVGGSYSPLGHARVSTQTGLPAVLGWPGHEHQWRGSFEPMGEREVDIGQLYRTRDAGQARAVVEKYGIRFVYVGDLERQTYGQLSERKFEAFLSLVYDRQGVRIYAWTEGSPADPDVSR